MTVKELCDEIEKASGCIHVGKASFWYGAIAPTYPGSICKQDMESVWITCGKSPIAWVRANHSMDGLGIFPVAARHAEALVDVINYLELVPSLCNNDTHLTN